MFAVYLENVRRTRPLIHSITNYVTANDYSPGIELVDAGENTVMCRTFSKIYGLGGMRVGWCYAPAPIVGVLNRIRSPFNVAVPSQVAAIAALEDHAFFDLCLAHNEMWRPWLAEQLQALGLGVTPSVTNFVLVHFPDASGAQEANACLQRHEVIVRPVANYGLPAALRISVGTEEEMRRVVAALTEYKEGAA